MLRIEPHSGKSWQPWICKLVRTRQRKERRRQGISLIGSKLLQDIDFVANTRKSTSLNRCLATEVAMATESTLLRLETKTIHTTQAVFESDHGHCRNLSWPEMVTISNLATLNMQIGLRCHAYIWAPKWIAHTFQICGLYDDPLSTRN